MADRLLDFAFQFVRGSSDFVFRCYFSFSRNPFALTDGAADAVAAMPLLYAKNIVGSSLTVFRIALLVGPRAP